MKISIDHEYCGKPYIAHKDTLKLDVTRYDKVKDFDMRRLCGFGRALNVITGIRVSGRQDQDKTQLQRKER